VKPTQEEIEWFRNAKEKAELNSPSRRKWYASNIKHMKLDTLWRHFDDLNLMVHGLIKTKVWQNDDNLTIDVNRSRDSVHSQIVKLIEAESPDKAIHWCTHWDCGRPRENEHGKCETCGRIPVKCEAWEVEACRKCRK